MSIELRAKLDWIESQIVILERKVERLKDENEELRRGLKESEKAVDYWRDAYLKQRDGIKEVLADADHK